MNAVAINSFQREPQSSYYEIQKDKAGESSQYMQNAGMETNLTSQFT